MRHRVTVKKFNRTSAHKKAMLSNMLTSLLKYEKIETTKEKGRAIKQLADKIIYKAKVDNVHNRRMAAKYVKDETILTKLFKDIAPRYADKNGGYVRKILSYKRFGDAADMCVVMLCESDSSSVKTENK
ncbi:50S ribosomal protein L17 [Brachyspira innocens]|uniref:50S ribosomal protein L17 n=1 Tax=Brachyspira innocens TaxID=13264 RepID=A0ABT8YVC2_9SPIR|nr:50S ribosomal protein L17 [Brachyspira innocens]MDO6992421.1 50S ribosomal protein L17 [Brachyspira innocens]MDO7019450.1 50S ribosomal protein L17 [Brachyspira innocens]